MPIALSGPRILATLLIVSLAQTAHAAAPISYAQIHKPYDALLERTCAAKHLDRLSPADLNDVIDPFRSALSSSQRAALDRAADPQRACADVIAGVSCANTAYLRAATRLKLLPKFARMVCNLPVACRAQSDCRKF